MNQGHTTRNAVMPEETIQALLNRVCSSAPIELVAVELEKRAPSVVDYLVDSDSAIAEEWQSLPADRLARVYEAIARGMGVPEEFVAEPDKDDPLFAAAENDRRAVGRAFADALLPALPHGLFPLLGACQNGLNAASSEVRSALWQEPDVVAGGSPALALAEFGLTPSHIVVASDAISMLIERATDAGFFERGQKLIFHRERTDGRYPIPIVRCLTHENRGNELSKSEIASEICAVASVEAATGDVLLDWLVDTAIYVRSLFHGLIADSVRENVILKPMPGTEEAWGDLYTRWGAARPVRFASVY
jgi:hypothetical protein